MKDKVIISKIKYKKEIAKDIFEFIIDADNELNNSKPGQFIHIKCGEGVYLRRPISICDVYDNNLRFIFQVKGKGTKILSEKKEGEYLDVLGPLGNGFSVSRKFNNPVVIGGGIGVYPMLMTAKKSGASAILGFRNKDAVTLYDDFKAVCENVYITTDDGSFSRKGFVTDVLKELIMENKVDAIFACGPHMMLKAIQTIAKENNIFCELSLEERMGCGIGACLCCATKIKDEELEEGYKFSHVCKHGPVFNSNEVIF